MGLFDFLKDCYNKIDEAETQRVCDKLSLEVAIADNNFLHYDANEACKKFFLPEMNTRSMGLIEPSEHEKDVFKELYAKHQAVLRKEYDKEYVELERIYRNHGITCNHCRKLALPITDTNRRYRCEGCGAQFVGSYHGY